MNEDIIPEDNLQLFQLKSKGASLCQKKKFLEAYDIYNKAYLIASQLGDAVAMGDISLSLGYVCSFIDESAMEKYYNRAIKVCKDKYTEALAYYNVGSIFMINGNLEKAYTYLNKGYLICEDKDLKLKFQENLFVYFSIAEDEKNKHIMIKELSNSLNINLFKAMNFQLKYDTLLEFQTLIKERKNDSLLYEYLYRKNCIACKKYKDFYLTLNFQ